MLSELYIQNLAVIEKTTVSFETGLNVFTGETGAGKSIVIDAINAILGQRISKDIVRTGTDKAVVHALFHNLSPNVLDKLTELGYEMDGDELMIQREISSDSKGMVRINGRPATVSVLHEIGELLINIHGQHDNQILLRPEKHIDILDAFGETADALKAYQVKYRELLTVHKMLTSLTANEAERAKKIDLLEYQVNEIQEAALHSDEEEQLENQKRAIVNYANILNCLQEAYQALFGDEEEIGASDRLSEAANALSGAAESDDSLLALSERITDLAYQVEDAAGEVSRALQEMTYNPGQLDEIEERLDLIQKLKRKYGNTIEEILQFLSNAQEELDRLNFSDERIQQLQEQESEKLQETRKLADELTDRRRLAAKRFTEKITEELCFLDMPNVRLEVMFQKTKMRAAGKDEVEFYISTNPGEPPKSLSKIASGGEMSRIMLAIKFVLADRDEIPTLIFDEVDTGISGRAAQKVGLKLKSVAGLRQIICVTHLAQIAALADTHFLIRKEYTGEKTYTKVHKLDFEGRKQEIARIIGTDKITDLTLKNAEEMLRQTI